MRTLNALLLNPYIYDFAAYSFWASPLGLLYMGSILRKNGFEIHLIDCMKTNEKKRKQDGRAPFFKEKVRKPEPLRDIKRNFRRYGMSPDELKSALSGIDEPDLILITSIMTYWYLGAKEALEIAKACFPHAAVVMGGIYPTLCDEIALSHLKSADLIVKSTETAIFYDFVEERFSLPLSFKPAIDNLDALPFPCYDLYHHIPFVPLLTSLGCVFSCTYCATPYMHPEMIRRGPSSVLEEITFWHDNHGVTKFVIYDDSFLYKKEAYAKPLLKKIAELPFSIEIYNPNAMNAAFIDDELARLFSQAGFREVRIGLESIDPAIQRKTGGKVDSRTFERALKALQEVGFGRDNMPVYILAGLPFQKWEAVRDAVDYVCGLGAKPYIAEYTPIPHTPMFDEYYRSARFPIAEEPLYQNNALFPFAWEGFTEEQMNSLKQYVRKIEFSR
ncbi:MAG TPA: radical SAM protein [Syntrophorhabdaceae bacterium]|nr:radical SAM protein [Syntrophorhabdaceae bacterium]